jgi:hypothetical protein
MPDHLQMPIGADVINAPESIPDGFKTQHMTAEVMLMDKVLTELRILNMHMAIINGCTFGRDDVDG